MYYNMIRKYYLEGYGYPKKYYTDVDLDKTKLISYKKDSSTVVEVENIYYKTSSSTIKIVNDYKYKKDSSTIV